MAKREKIQVVTANDLLEGDVVYFTADDTWSKTMRDASVAKTQDDADHLLQRASQQQNRVVGPDLTEVNLDDAGLPHPTHFREKFRASGPSLP